MRETDGKEGGVTTQAPLPWRSPGGGGPEEPGTGEARGDAEYGAVLDRVQESLRRRTVDLTRERGAARGALGELLAQAPARRSLMVRNLSRFRSWWLGELLLRESQRARLEDPQAGRQLATLAQELAVQLDPRAYGRGMVLDLRARASAEVADCCRILGDLEASDRAFAAARQALDEGPGEGPATARVLALHAALLRTQRRFQQSGELLDRAFALCHEAGDRPRAAEALLDKAVLRREAGAPDEAIWLLRRAGRCLEGEHAPRLSLWIRHGLICCLVDLRRFRQAEELLVATMPLFQRFPERSIQLRLRWLEAWIAVGTGQLGRAESLLTAVRQDCSAMGCELDAAIVGLDLASLYERQGRAEEMRRVALEILPYFRAQAVYREARAAERLLARSTAREACG